MLWVALGMITDSLHLQDGIEQQFDVNHLSH
jgi:hypothetical protein